MSKSPNTISERWSYFIFLLIILYLASPWFFERKLLFNEIIAFTGLLIWGLHRFGLFKDQVSLYVYGFLGLCGLHMIVSIWRADNFYVYLRNLVIVYSAFSFFLGSFLMEAWRRFIQKFWTPLAIYLGLGLLIPVGTLPYQSLFYERFGLSVLFPNLLKKLPLKWLLPGMVVLTLIYAFTYNSATAIIIAGFFGLLWICKSYRIFKWICGLSLAAFVAFFMYVQPNLNLIRNRFTPYSDDGILDVRHSMKILAVDPNSTWRLVLWKEVLVDHFPENIPGMGFGTRVMEIFPVEDVSKIPILPYVLGAHNSYIYLFGRLGILYLIMTALLYRAVFKEYFLNRAYYHQTGNFTAIWGFFAISLIALFNPTMESSIYASSYWFFMGLTAAVMRERMARTQSPAIAS